MAFRESDPTIIADPIIKKIKRQRNAFFHQHGGADSTTMMEINYVDLGKVLEAYEKMRQAYNKVSKIVELAKKL